MITKNYIKMCEKAGEIQKLFNPNGHNHMYGSGSIWTDIDRDAYKYDKYTEYGHQYIHITDGYLMHRFWLPTQEQLQGMVKDADFHIWGSFDHLFLESAEDYHRRNSYHISNNSMNKLWLAFVMKEKYSKIWNGKNWAKK